MITDDITFVPWPPPGMGFYEDKTQCLFCGARATQCAYHISPYCYTIANRCCDRPECVAAALDLTREFIRFDIEINRR